MKHDTSKASSAEIIVRQLPRRFDAEAEGMIEATTTRLMEITLTDKRWEQLQWLADRCGDSLTWEVESLLSSCPTVEASIARCKRADAQKTLKELEAA